ncbi:histidine phosphatase family protein [Granulicella cerasi]|uniref:Histidine phosphatase family protein n=1 Tax=Granulicella cerasi TaxID=741063 RepID=A0ABW1ZBF0_9BACT|nr:histidine phosphatase family protein [Granulicella cerasi]
MRVFFTRHAQSAANVGLSSDDFALIPLTEYGHAQAAALAAHWDVVPDLIIVSPFFRTRQTAQPTLDRFAHVPVEYWPVHEFTNLEPSRWNGSQPSERLPFVQQYWQQCDPAYCDGPGAESFSQLLGRAQAALDRLSQLPPDTEVLLFTHGFFLNAIRSLLRAPAASHAEHMLGFVPAFRQQTIANADRLEMTFTANAGWRIVEHHAGFIL